MSIDEIKQAVGALSPVELSDFRDWLLLREDDAWDLQMQEDAKAGRLDHLAQAALADHRAGKTTPLNDLFQKR